jgi:hypothetical protein
MSSSGHSKSGVTAGGPESALSPEWVIGFIEAEGSFTHDNGPYNTYPKFCMTQRNRDILEKIIDVLPVDVRVYECRDDFYRINFKGREKTLAMIEFLEGRLHANYSRERFQEWKKIYCQAYGTPAELEVDN